MQGNNAYGLLGKYDPTPEYENKEIHVNKQMLKNNFGKILDFLISMNPIRLFKADAKENNELE